MRTYFSKRELIGCSNYKNQYYYKHDIAKWLDEMGIKNYFFRGNAIVDVYSGVDISRRGLKNIPVKFGYVQWDFDCSYNELTSLEGSPEIVNGIFDCSGNKLTNLRGGPKKTTSSYYCRDAGLVSLQGAPISVGGDFSCNGNPLKTLKGGPVCVGGYYSCYNCELETLEGAPRQLLYGFFDCSFNSLETLEGGPEYVKGNYACNSNHLIAFRGAPRQVGGDFKYAHNLLPDSYLERFDFSFVEGDVYGDN